MLNIITHNIRRVLARLQRLSAMRNLRQSVGKRCYLSPKANDVWPERLRIGSYVWIGVDCVLDAEGGLEIGDGTILASKVTVLSSTHEYWNVDLLPFSAMDRHQPTKIGRGVWLGWGASVAPGVTIGDGAVIGMCSVVVHDVPAGAVVAGNPARVIKQRDPELLKKLLETESYYIKAKAEGRAQRAGRTNVNFTR